MVSSIPHFIDQAKKAKTQTSNFASEILIILTTSIRTSYMQQAPNQTAHLPLLIYEDV